MEKMYIVGFLRGTKNEVHESCRKVLEMEVVNLPEGAWYKAKQVVEKEQKESRSIFCPDPLPYYGERVKIRENSIYSGYKGTVKDVRLAGYKALVAIDGVPDPVWISISVLMPEE